MTDFDDFKVEWLGRRVDWDHVFNFQCVDLILQYLAECYDINGAYGNAIDFWTNPVATVLAKFSKIQTAEAQKGDIVILNGLAGNPYGHIGIATGNIDASNVEILEQNGSTGNGDGLGGNAIRTRYVPKYRVAGLLRPIQVAAPLPATPPYTVQNENKKVQLIRDTHKWDCARRNFDDRAANPVEDQSNGYVFDVQAVYDTYDGNLYYAPDITSSFGFNTKDCIDYTPPPPPPPPAAPIPIVRAEKYTLVNTLMYFDSSIDASMRQNAKGTIDSGEYFVFDRKNKTLNLSTDNVKDQNKWVNSEDNVISMVAPRITAIIQAAAQNIPKPSLPASYPNQWKATNSSLRLDRQPVVYISKNLQPIRVFDLDSKGEPQLLSPLTLVPVVSTFQKDGILYGRTQKVADRGLWYGIPMSTLKQESVYTTITSVAERFAMGTQRFLDYPIKHFAKFERFIDGIKETKTRR